MQDSEERISFRQAARDRGVLFEDLWRSFWEGEFEPRSKTKLTVKFTSGPNATEDPATRTLLDGIILGPCKDAELSGKVWGAKSPEERWAVVAQIPYEEVDRQWREFFFERITIAKSDLDEWNLRRNAEDKCGKWMRAVIDDARRLRDSNPKMSYRALARELTSYTGKFMGYREDAIREILSGRYGPARTRNIGSL